MTDQTGPDPSYPVSLDVSGRPCLVVGGGPVAAHKARGLVACGAVVSVIAPEVGADMEALAPSLHAVQRRTFEPGDVSGYRLVITATGDTHVDGAVFRAAESSGVWVNSADDRAHSSFILPAVHRDEAVTVSVSTGGLSPALAVWLRDRVVAHCGTGVGTLAQMLGAARERLRHQGVRLDTVDWRALLDGPLPDLVDAGDMREAHEIVARATAQAATEPESRRRPVDNR
jgi:siroheme synthase-like protein